MARRRTRQEKIVAKLRRKDIAEVKPNIDMPGESLPAVSLGADLTRTAIVAILALLLQAGMFYLFKYRGGWEIISGFWERG